MKIYAPMLWFTLFLQLTFCCNTPTSPVAATEANPSAIPPQKASKQLSQAQIDSILMLQGKVLPNALWAIAFEEPPAKTPVFILTGNLDQDPEPELVLWYYWEAMHPMGELCLLDQKQSGWEKIGTEYLDFFRGTTPPSIDNQNKMLLTYSYGSGSGYGAEVLNFYQNHNDSLTCVFRLLETEGCNILGCSAFRSIHAGYQFKDSSQILATYRYEVCAGLDSRYPEKIIFEKKLVIPFDWDSRQKLFLPKLPPDFPPPSTDSSGFLDYGENTFDIFFEAELEKIKRHGPRWKRVALGNPEEN